MPGGPLLARAREVWAGLAGAPVAFPAGSTVKVVASTRSLLCPPQWVGIVVLGGAGIATVPANSLVDVVQQALDGLPADCATDAGRLRAELPVADVRGPATLAYLDGSEFHPVPASVAVEELSSDHRDLAVLLASVEPEDAEECGLAEITSRAFMIRDGHTIAAAAGYRRWPGSVAHLCVLTAPEQRGRGLAPMESFSRPAPRCHGRRSSRLGSWHRQALLRIDLRLVRQFSSGVGFVPQDTSSLGSVGIPAVKGADLAADVLVSDRC